MAAGRIGLPRFFVRRRQTALSVHRARSRAQAALLQGLLHAAYRTATSNDPDAATLRGVAEGFHDVVAQEVGQQDDQLGAGGQLQRLFLV